MSETLFLSRLFKFEWIYEERAEFNNVFLRSLRYFETSGWVKLVGESVRPVSSDEEPAGQIVCVSDPLPVELQFFRRQVLSFLEAYTIVAGCIEDFVDARPDEAEVLKTILKRARTDYEQDRIIFWESLSKPTYRNALRLLDDWGVVEREWDATKKKMTYRVPAEAVREQRHQKLLEHLEAFTYPERGERATEEATD